MKRNFLYQNKKVIMRTILCEFSLNHMKCEYKYLRNETCYIIEYYT